MMRSRRLRDLMAGAGATAGLLGILVGVPVALATAVGWPLGRSVPSVDTVVTALRYGQIAPSTMLRALAVVLWVTWAMAVVSIALEAMAVARGTVARALPGLDAMQAAAGHLVATIMLLASLPTRAVALPTTASTSSTAPVPVVAHDHAAPPAVSARDGAAGTSDTRRLTNADARIWTVQRRDSLWTIAERTLGDGRRWKEIAALNEHRVQPDGGRLRPGDTMIHPGWRLELPSDADPAVRPRRVTVAQGDTLWSLAAEHLDDGHDWRRIYARNRGRRQADGGRLTDPDLIHPGWVLRMPADRGSAEVNERDEGTPTSSWSAARGAADQRGTSAAAPADAGEPRDEQRPTRPSEATDRRVRPATSRADAAAHRDDQPTPEADGTDRQHERTPPTDATDRRYAPADPDPAGRPPVAPPVTPSTLAGDDRPSEYAASDGTRAGRRTVAPLMEPTSSTAPDVRVVLLGAAALLAAGLVGLIAQRRRHWLRRRRVGAVPDPVDPEAAEFERWLRSMAEHDLRERLDRLQRALTDHFAEHDVAPVVTAVEFDEQVTLRLGEPLAQAPPGVTSSEDGSRWTLARELEMAPAAPHRYLPALISCGRLPSGALLLVNPLAVDVLSVAGSPAQIADALTSWTAELATGGASSGVDVVVVGSHHPLIERLPRVTVVADVAQALDRVRRVTDDRAGFATHVVVLCGDHTDRERFDALADAARHPRAGLVVAGDHRASVCLEIAGAHTRLTPDDRWIDAPEWLTPQQWDRFGELLRQPSRDPVPHPVPTALLSLATSAEPLTEAVLEADDAGLIEVGVLGPLTIDGRPSTLDPEASSALTYLATHLTGAAPETVATILWPTDPDRVERLDRSCAVVTAALEGTDDRPVVIRTDDGRLELSSTVTTDLRAFHTLLHALDQLPVTIQARRLDAALALVRGEPFAAGADWAHAEGLATRTAGLIIDVAHRLAMQALSVGDPDRAASAVDRGLLAAPGCELLYRDRIRIADARGDHAAIDACMRELRALVEADDGWVTPETVELYNDLRSGPGTSTGELREDGS